MRNAVPVRVRRGRVIPKRSRLRAPPEQAHPPNRNAAVRRLQRGRKVCHLITPSTGCGACIGQAFPRAIASFPQPLAQYRDRIAASANFREAIDRVIAIAIAIAIAVAVVIEMVIGDGRRSELDERSTRSTNGRLTGMRGLRVIGCASI